MYIAVTRRPQILRYADDSGADRQAKPRKAALLGARVTKSLFDE
jgi:hypothetical protein